MHPADIKALLHKSGATQAQIARDLKVSDVAISHVVHDKFRSHRIARAIAEKTGIPIEQLWPNRYNTAA